MIIVDYKCRGCGDVAETFVASPPPSSQKCTLCGEDARRLFTTAGLVDRGRPSPHLANTSCAANPDVPGLCHVKNESARRVLIAGARGDDHALEKERKKQTKVYESRGATSASEVFTHSHKTTGTSGHTQSLNSLLKKGNTHEARFH